MYFNHPALHKNKFISFTPQLIMMIVVLLTNSFANGQQVIWAKKNNLDKKTDFTKIIGQNKHGLYALKHRNSSFKKYFIIEKFDKNMNLLYNKTIKIPNAELQKIIVMPDEVVFFTKIYEKGYLYSLAMHHLDSNLNTDAPVILLGNCELLNSFADFKIDYNQDKNKILVWYINTVGDETMLHFQALEDEKKTFSRNIKVDYPVSDLDMGKSICDNAGNFYCLYTASKNFKSSKAIDYKNFLLCVNMKSGAVKNSLLHKRDTFISNYDLSYNSGTGKIHITGFYGQKDEDDNKGYFEITVNPEKFAFEHQVFTEIDRKTVAAIVGAKYEQKGENLNKFKIRKTVPKMDGCCLIIAERSFITTQSDVFYVNGMPQTSYAKIFNNDELLLLSLDSSGHLVWTETVIKTQSSVNDGGYFNGIIIMVNDDNVNIIYNDRLSANADVIQITYKENGEHSKKILLNSDQYYALVIPAEYNQVSSNSIVLPINQNRDYTYIKLLY